MSADLLRQAAAILRERATEATPEGHTYPWRYTEATYGDPADGPTHVAVTCCGAHGAQPSHFIVAEDWCAESGHIAYYIATMHPGVGLALAVWLDAEFAHQFGPSEHAIEVARLIVGGAS